MSTCALRNNVFRLKWKKINLKNEDEFWESVINRYDTTHSNGKCAHGIINEMECRVSEVECDSLSNVNIEGEWDICIIYDIMTWKRDQIRIRVWICNDWMLLKWLK